MLLLVGAVPTPLCGIMAGIHMKMLPFNNLMPLLDKQSNELCIWSAYTLKENELMPLCLVVDQATMKDNNDSGITIKQCVCVCCNLYSICYVT